MKIKPYNIFTPLILIILYISIAITQIYEFNCKEVEKASNILYDENSLTFTITKEDFIVNDLKKKMPDNSAIFSQMSGDINVRGICFKGYIDQPKLKEGRFFTEEDFDGKKNLAVIGSDVTAYKESGKEFIIYKNKKYYVIGIIGYRMPTKLDSTVFLSLNDQLLEQDIVEYVITGGKLQDNLDFLGNEDMLGHVTIFERHQPNLLHIISTGKAQKITVTLFAICIIFNTYMVLYFCIEKEGSKYAIKIMNGYTIRQIKTGEMKKFLFINVGVIGIGGGILFCLVYKQLLIDLFVLGKSSILYLGFAMTLFYILLHVQLIRLGRFDRKGGR